MAEILDIQQLEQAGRVSKQDTGSIQPIRPSENYLVILGRRPGQADCASKQATESTQGTRLFEDGLVVFGKRWGQAECVPRQDVELWQLTSPSENQTNSLDQLAEQTESRRMWQSVGIGLIVTAIVGATSGTWFYLTGRLLHQIWPLIRRLLPS